MRLIWTLLLSFFSGISAAEEMLYVVHMDNIKEKPYQSSCAEKPSPPKENSNEEIESICVTNICGENEISFTIDRVIIGNKRETIVLNYFLDEWCRA